MKRIMFLVIIVIAFLVVKISGVGVARHPEGEAQKAAWWQFQSIDTMKYSRDVSREKLNDPTFDAVIEKQVQDIAATGATHIGIATPYDDEFLPILKRWVTSSRKHNLRIWYRGNWSGWERWFGYDKISREEHIQKTGNFIRTHADLFEDGDVFSGCPECENGGPGNPQVTGDIAGHKKFLIDEYAVTKRAFADIGKNVASNYFSMNGDVARLVMDKQTTEAVDGIVTIDHYVASPDKLVADIRALAAQSGGRVVLGEFGAPIPDIHGVMDEDAQANYIEKTFRLLAGEPALVGINYWVNVGGSTLLWNDDGNPRKAVSVIRNYFSPRVMTGRVLDEIGRPINGALVTSGARSSRSGKTGAFTLPVIAPPLPVTVTAESYIQTTITTNPDDQLFTIHLKRISEPLWFRFAKFVRKIGGKSS